MSEENVNAPGPVDANAHIDPNAKPEQRTDSDPRAERLQRERENANAIPDFEYPAGAVIVQELQDIRSELGVFGPAVLIGVWLSGLAVGYTAFIYYKNRSTSEDTDSE